MSELHSCFSGIAGASAVTSQFLSLGEGFPIYKELQEWVETATIKTLPQLLNYAHDTYRDRPFLGKRVGDHFEFETHDQVYKKVNCFASALISLDMKPGDRIANFSKNRPEWPVIDYGTVFAAGVHVPMYATLSKDELLYILRDCEARCVVVGDADQLRKVISIEDQCPNLEHIISLVSTDCTSTKQLWNWNDFIEYGRVRLTNNSAHIRYLCNQLTPWDVATFVYTSGTTGNPKGVMLMHGNLCSQACLLKDRLRCVPGDVELCYLPLSHVFERQIGYTFTLGGVGIGYANGIHTVMQDLQDLKPTLFITVPLLLHKIYDRVMDSPDMKRTPSLKWAVKVGRSYSAAQRAGRVSKFLQAKQAMARSVLGSGLQKRLGGNIRLIVSGGAPLRPEVGQFFNDVHIRVVEGYGLTETSPVLSINPLDAPHAGTVGTIIENLEVTIDDGEIVARGPNIMRGYYKQPDATAATFDKDGWFHTGDIGNIDADGYLSITDRKKCIIVLANGKNVAPSGIEQKLCMSKWIARAVLVGDNAQYVAALIVPDFEKVKEWAQEQNLEGTMEDWVENADLKTIINNDVHELCLSLSNYEKVKRIAILSHDFSQDAGELTASFKVKHRAVEEHYADIIAKLLNKA